MSCHELYTFFISNLGLASVLKVAGEFKNFRVQSCLASALKLIKEQLIFNYNITSRKTLSMFPKKLLAYQSHDQFFEPLKLLKICLVSYKPVACT